MQSAHATSTAVLARRPTDRILIVDDHAVLAGAVVRMLRARGLDASAVCGPTVADVVSAARARAPVVVLLDLDLGPLGCGADLVGPLRAVGAHVCVISGSGNRTGAALAIERGAVGVIEKTTPVDDLLAAIERLTNGEALLSEQQRAIWLAELAAERERLAPFERLTPHEQTVLGSLAAGLSPEETANDMFIAVSTVRSHIKSVFRKLGVHSQLGAVALAAASGWHAPPR